MPYPLTGFQWCSFRNSSAALCWTQHNTWNIDQKVNPHRQIQFDSSPSSLSVVVSIILSFEACLSVCQVVLAFLRTFSWVFVFVSVLPIGLLRSSIFVWSRHTGLRVLVGTVAGFICLKGLASGLDGLLSGFGLGWENWGHPPSNHHQMTAFRRSLWQNLHLKMKHWNLIQLTLHHLPHWLEIHRQLPKHNHCFPLLSLGFHPPCPRRYHRHASQIHLHPVLTFFSASSLSTSLVALV